MRERTSINRRIFIWIGLVILIIAHQDIWFWDSIEPLILGQIPVGLTYHILISILIACFWALVVRFAWPSEIEAWVDDSNPPISEENKSPE